MRAHRMQCIKMKSTLRVGPKNEKTSPRIVKRVGSQKNQIKNFLDFRKNIKKSLAFLNTNISRAQ